MMDGEDGFTHLLTGFGKSLIRHLSPLVALSYVILFVDLIG